MPQFHLTAVDTDPASRSRGERKSIHQVQASSKAEAERKISEWRQENPELRFEGVSIGGVMSDTEFARWREGQVFREPATGGITRTEKEQEALEQQAATAALEKIEAGEAQASEETIAKLKAKEKTQKEFVEERTLGRLQAGTTATFAPGAGLKEEPVEVKFSPLAFARAKEVLKPTERGIIFDTDRELRTTARIIPDVPEPKEAIDVPLYKPSKELRIEPYKEKAELLPTSKPELQATAFEQRVLTAQEREREFFTSKGFERIEATAGLLTGGYQKREGAWGVVPIEERGFIGATAQKFVEPFLSWPIALGGALPSAGEKLAATGEALTFGRREVPGGYVQVRRKEVAKEFGVGVPTRLAEEWQAMPPYEKAATIGFITAAPLIGGPALRKGVTLAERAKILRKMPKAQRTKALEAERFARELQRVEPPVKQIDLASTERLPPKAARVTEKFLLQKKKDVIVGGSVAQRTQTYVPTRRPHDIDVYTKGSPTTAAKELETSLKKAGVERVSRVGTEITIEGKKAVEFHEVSKVKANIREVIPPWMPTSVAITKTPRGIRVLKLGIQARRKLIGGYYEGRFEKDIPDFQRIARSLERTKEIQARPSLFFGKRAMVGFGKPLKEPKVLKRKPTTTKIGRVGEPAGKGGDYISRAYPKRIQPYPSYPKGYPKYKPYKPTTKYPSYKPAIKERPYVPYKPEVKPYPTPKPSEVPYKPVVSTPYKVPVKEKPYPARVTYPRPTKETPYISYLDVTPTPTKRRIPPAYVPLPKPHEIKPVIPRPPKKRKRKFRGTPSLSVVLGGVGTPLTRGQIAGKEFISPVMIRQLRK